MSKNPVRGYITCPVCESASTVHQIGEGKLIESGELPNNPRNLGKMYYKCPKCGNASMSKSTHDFVVANMVTEQSALVALPVRVDQASSGVEEVLPEVLSSTTETVTPSAQQTATLPAAETSTDAASSAIEALEPDEIDTDDTQHKKWRKSVVIALVVLFAIGLMIYRARQRLALAELQEVEHVAIA